jgi:hypothetical protein
MNVQPTTQSRMLKKKRRVHEYILPFMALSCIVVRLKKKLLGVLVLKVVIAKGFVDNKRGTL